MKKILKLVLICFSLALICFVIGACGEKEDVHTDISVSNDFTYAEGVFKTTVASNVVSYDLNSKIEIFEKSKMEISKSTSFAEMLDGSKLALEQGDNIFYVKISNKKIEDQVYKFNIFRNPVLNIKFNTNGGSSVNSISVDSGTIIEAPKSVKTGYDLSWDYDFSKPVTSSMTINAIWTPRNYKITIASNEDGIENVVLDIVFDSVYDLADKVSKEGYRVAGFYYKEGDSEIEFSTQGVYTRTSDVVIYAKYEPIKYSITYMLEKSATNPNSVLEFTIETVFDLLDAQWKNNEKVFAGWYTSNDYAEENKITQISNMNQSLTLWAKFDPVIFKTSVNCYDGDKLINQYEFQYNSAYELKQPSKKGYTFDGWYIEDELVELSGIWAKKDKTVDLKAKFTAINYSINYDLPQGAQNNATNKAEYNADMGKVVFQAPSFGNHEFIGWYLDANFTKEIKELTLDNVTNGMTIYSKWQYVTNVTFDLNGGNCDTTQAIYRFGKEYKLPSIEKNGYVFDGWYYGEVKVESTGNWTYIDDKIDLVARFNVRNIKVIYNLPNGVNNDVNLQEYNIEMGNIELKAPTFGNHQFEGWYLDEAYKTPITELTYDILKDGVTIYSKWQYVTNVIFEANGGTCEITNERYYFGKGYELPMPENKGYVFNGWYYGNVKLDSVGDWRYTDAEITLVADYFIRENDIVYVLPEGAQNNSANPSKYDVEDGIVTLQNPTFGNHEFLGWYLDANFTTQITELTVDNVTSEMSLYPKWQYVTEVIFDANGGTCDITNETYYFGKDYTLPKVEKKGYVFDGWYYEDVKVDSANWIYNDAEITLVAKYTPRTNDIVYILPDGAENNDANKSEYNADMGKVVLQNPSFGNHEFLGWYLDANFTTPITELTVDNVTNEMTIYSKWQYVTKVTFESNGGVCDKTNEIYYFGKEYTLPKVEKIGYVFDGWYYGEKKVESVGAWAYRDADVTLVAKYTLINYKLSYNLPNASVNNSQNPSLYNIENGTITLQKPSFGDHIFIGWYTDAACSKPISTLTIENITDGMTIYSKWQYVSNVIFDVNGANSALGKQQYLFGQTYTLPTPIKSGCLFEGWYYGDVKVENGEWKYTNDITLVANWVPTTIAINYVLNGGVQNSQNPQTFDVFTGIIELKDPTNNNKGFSFDGWYTDSSFTNRITSIDTSVVRDITLYAKWSGIKVPVTFDADSGYIAESSQTMIYGSAYSLPIPERVGYKFDGWYYNGQLFPSKGTWSLLSTSGSFVAKWTLEKYTITYDLGGATESEIYDIVKDSEGNDKKVSITFTKEYDVHSSDIVIPKLRKDGYIFLGWKTNTGYAQSITVSSGSVGNRTYTAVWCSKTDNNGFVYELVDDHMVCINYTATPSSLQSVNLPSYYNSYPVTTIASNAFSDFGVKFGNSSYKNNNYYFTIVLPKTITLIQENAFINCNGICVSVRDENGNILDFKSADELKEWEKTVDYGSTKVDKQMRDCIWGFRPAIGWTRFSAVEIPDDYE